MEEILSRLQQARRTEERNNIFKEFLEALKKIKVDLTGRRGNPVDFARIPGPGSNELQFRNRLLWLRTIPLKKEECFIILHAESGVYMNGKKGRCSADLLGLFRDSRTTQFAIAELKYGEGGDHLLYAIAEGLRNIYLHLQGFDRLKKGWKIKTKLEKNAWGNRNPFVEVSKKKGHLLIVGDNDWIEKQEALFKYVKSEIPLGEDFPDVEISVYSAKEGAKAKSNPYALLPLERIQ